MDVFENEGKNRDYFFEIIKKKVPMQNEMFKKNDWKFMLDKEVPIPYRHIYFPLRNELEICCFKQDICIYSKLLDKSIGHREAAITARGIELLKVVLNKNAPNNDLNIGLPLVIIEAKLSKYINTHVLLAYSEKIKMVKSIFPYCKAYLLCFGEFKRNVYRHGSGFDEAFFIKNLNDKECDPVIKQIADSLNAAISKMLVTA